MRIGEVVKNMEDGYPMQRTGWNGEDMFIMIQEPDIKSKMTEPYVYMSSAVGGKIPWLCSQADLLADDWNFVV
jgi:hypothetical protein